MTKSEELVSLLIDKGHTISFAESCTGGMAAASIVDVADASKVLNASFVTYANEAKIKYANVSGETLDKYGAVSEQTAGEMAEGTARANNADVAVGISGIALSLIGQLGDFSASCIKRYVDIKDYSNLLPGHGGMLDRIDSVLFIAPFAYMLFTII